MIPTARKFPPRDELHPEIDALLEILGRKLEMVERIRVQKPERIHWMGRHYRLASDGRYYPE